MKDREGLSKAALQFIDQRRLSLTTTPHPQKTGVLMAYKTQDGVTVVKHLESCRLDLDSMEGALDRAEKMLNLKLNAHVEALA